MTYGVIARSRMPTTRKQRAPAFDEAWMSQAVVPTAC
jgi:hypothetical protein